jgi:hypothetical protein
VRGAWRHHVADIEQLGEGGARSATPSASAWSHRRRSEPGGKQRPAARAAARLVWLELILARSGLLGAATMGEWPDDFRFSDDVWTAQRDRLALGWQFGRTRPASCFTSRNWSPGSEPRSNGLDQFAPELRARAAEAIPHPQRAAPRPRAIRPPRLPAEERHCRPGGGHAERSPVRRPAQERWRPPAW